MSLKELIGDVHPLFSLARGQIMGEPLTAPPRLSQFMQNFNNLRMTAAKVGGQHASGFCWIGLQMLEQCLLIDLNRPHRTRLIFDVLLPLSKFSKPPLYCSKIHSILPYYLAHISGSFRRSPTQMEFVK